MNKQARGAKKTPKPPPGGAAVRRPGEPHWGRSGTSYTVFVSSCDECPCADWHNGECKHPQTEEMSILDDERVPDGCPLHKRKLVVEVLDG